MEQGNDSGGRRKGSNGPYRPGTGAIVTLVATGMFLVMGGAAVAPALPAMGEALHASETAMSLVITLPPLAVAISGLFMGALADRFGKARTLMVSLAVFTVAGLSGLFLPTLESLLVGRFIMGIGIGGIAASASALVADYFDEKLRTKIYGWQSAASGVSVLVLETGGGFLALLGWRIAFSVYLVGLVGFILALLFIREPDHARVRHEGGDAPAGAASSPGAVLAIAIAVAFALQAITYLVPAKMPYLVTAFGESTAVAGLFLGGFGLANIVGSLASAPLQARLARSTLTVGCFASLAAGCALMAAPFGIGAVLVGAVLIGLGTGCITPAFVNWVASTSTPENSGKRMGAFATAINLGQFSCTLLSGGLLALFGTHQAVFIAAAMIALAAAVAAALARQFMNRV